MITNKQYKEDLIYLLSILVFMAAPMKDTNEMYPQIRKGLLEMADRMLAIPDEEEVPKYRFDPSDFGRNELVKQWGQAIKEGFTNVTHPADPDKDEYMPNEHGDDNWATPNPYHKDDTEYD